MKYLQLMRPAIGIVLLYILYIHTYCMCHCRLTKSYILHYVAHVSMLISPAICSAMLMLHVHMCELTSRSLFSVYLLVKNNRNLILSVCLQYFYTHLYIRYAFEPFTPTHMHMHASFSCTYTAALFGWLHKVSA